MISHDMKFSGSCSFGPWFVYCLQHFESGGKIIENKSLKLMMKVHACYNVKKKIILI